jgi:integrase
MSATTTKKAFPPLVKTATKGVYKRGGSYVIRYRDPSGKQKKHYVKTYAEAKRIRSELAADVSRGEYRATTKLTFGQHAPKWIDSYQGRTKRGIGPRTLALYRADLGLDVDGQPTGSGAVAFVGRMMLSEIGASDLAAYGTQLSKRGLSQSSVRRALAPVKALLADAHDRDNLIRFNPAAGVRIFAPVDQTEEATEKVKALKPEELSALLAATPEQWLTFMSFLAETGLRVGEAIEVRWSDLDRGKGVLTVARQFHRGTVTLPKGRKTRRIRVSKRMDAMLWEQRKQTKGADSDLVFTAERGSRIDQKNFAARVLKPACEAAGVGDWPSFHTMRHSCATQLFRTGWNAPQVARFLGHSDAGFTLRTYVHLLDDDLPTNDVLDSLDKAAEEIRQADESRRNEVVVAAVR